MNRRSFLQSLTAALASSPLAALSMERSSEFAARDQVELGFSTLGCPSWDWMTILDFAAKHGFATIELRGLQTTMDLTERPEFRPDRIERSKHDLATRRLRISCLGSSARMHETEPAARRAQMDEARRFIDLATRLGAPYVRVFGDRLGAAPRDQVLAHVADRLRELGSYAADRGVTVLIESHGDFVDFADATGAPRANGFAPRRAALGCPQHVRGGQRGSRADARTTWTVHPSHAHQGLPARREGAAVRTRRRGRCPRAAPGAASGEERIHRGLFPRMGKALALGDPGARDCVSTLRASRAAVSEFLKFARWLRVSGWLGEIRFVRTQYLSHVTDWYSGWEWVRTRASGRSHLLAAGCHAVDALRWCSGREPIEVSAFHTRFTPGYEWPTSIVENLAP